MKSALILGAVVLALLAAEKEPTPEPPAKGNLVIGPSIGFSPCRADWCMNPPVPQNYRAVYPDGGVARLGWAKGGKVVEYTAHGVEFPDGGFIAFNAPRGTRVEPLEPDGGVHAHCWHARTSVFVNAVVGAEPERWEECCHCGSTMKPPPPVRRAHACAGHGPNCWTPLQGGFAFP